MASPDSPPARPALTLPDDIGQRLFQRGGKVDAQLPGLLQEVGIDAQVRLSGRARIEGRLHG
jgi:hypothetical protein